MRQAHYIIAIATLAACNRPAADPSVHVDCYAACETGRRLGCAWTETTPAGLTCEAWCERTEATGYTTMHPACVAAAKTCEEADACQR
jgi:hypothetical protein